MKTLIECSKCGHYWTSNGSPSVCPNCKSSTWFEFRTEFEMIEPIHVSLEKVKENKEYVYVNNVTTKSFGNRVCKVYTVPKKRVKIASTETEGISVYLIGELLVGVKIGSTGRIFLKGRNVNELMEE